MKKLTAIVTLILLSSIYSFSQNIPDAKWKSHLVIKEGLYIPFNLVTENSEFYIINSEEKIHLKKRQLTNDSIALEFPVFDSEIRAKLSDSLLEGIWYNYSKGKYKMNIKAFIEPPLDYTIPFPSFDPTGKWDAWFSPGTENENYMIGVFKGKGTSVTGTFLSETGDYRYLQGNQKYRDIKLSTFDGAHAYLFDFKFINKDSIIGTYYSGFRWSEPFVMKRNPDAKLRDPDELTSLKDGYDKFEFNFKNLEGKTISNNDDRFKNKVVIVQIMGSWCPNCMDEIRFFNELYKEYNDDGLEIVAITFERNDKYEDFERNLTKLKKDLEVQYDILFGGSTKDSKEQLPMLTKLMSYPTAIFIDRQGKVRKIHTGFSGPGTGEVYEKQKAKTTYFVEKLIKE